jgi:predicted metal-binding protein
MISDKANLLTEGSRRPTKPVIITVCVSCQRKTGLVLGSDGKERPGKILFDAVCAASKGHDDVIVRPTQCLSVCTRVCTATITSREGYSFVFGELDASMDAMALVTMAQSSGCADYGFVPWKDRPEALRKGLIARIPPPDWSPDDGSAPA